MTPQDKAALVRCLRKHDSSRLRPPITLAGVGKVQSDEPPRESLAKGPRLYWTKHGR